jgi:regulator of sirC expression with transglutaminase-like and TPR domain
MKKTAIYTFLVFLYVILSSIKILPGLEQFEKSKIKTLYKNLNSTSVIQHFAFYRLYPDTAEGKQALKKAWSLLDQENVKDSYILPSLDINLMINLVNKQGSTLSEIVDEEKLVFLESLGKNLKNRSLKGHKIWDIQEIVKLNVDEIDLARALFLEELEQEKNAVYKTRYFEVCLDLMALQILATLKDNASDIDKINAINDFIFYEKKFRFPPQSNQAREIDTYTFLSSVIDSRRGVCLGVSILYLSLAQRLGLNLEIITPPGHIYVRYNKSGNIINIETTARGVNYPSEIYLGIETKKLQQRNIKEVVGLAFINQASVYWANEHYDTAVSLYKKSMKYLPQDPHLKQMLGLNLLFTGNEKEGKELLKELRNYKSEYLTGKDNLVEDFLDNKTDIESLKAIFLPIDEKRSSIIEKQNSLKKIVEKFPKFRAGIFQLTNTYLQLGREKEASKYLNQLYQIDPNDITVNYYLSVISFERLDYQNAWKYLKNTENLLEKENHHPRALKSFKEMLKRTSPSPI